MDHQGRAVRVRQRRRPARQSHAGIEQLSLERAVRADIGIGHVASMVAGCDEQAMLRIPRREVGARRGELLLGIAQPLLVEVEAVLPGRQTLQVGGDQDPARRVLQHDHAERLAVCTDHGNVDHRRTRCRRCLMRRAVLRPCLLVRQSGNGSEGDGGGAEDKSGTGHREVSWMAQTDGWIIALRTGHGKAGSVTNSCRERRALATTPS
ncbi:hypothetical protein NOVOSPHI9U_10030 [Novosphingobium sp. 9U]|nr:hypothetical protein NOVOSPHI9U_10030 [Novosphingobium sp. 9U]